MPKMGMSAADEYTRRAWIGRGRYADVFQVQRGGQEYALKVIQCRTEKVAGLPPPPVPHPMTASGRLGGWVTVA